MQEFTEQEIAYLESQILGRLATANAQGQPHVTPVGFRYNEETGTIDIGGYDLSSTKKVRDLEQNPRIAFVVDDLGHDVLRGAEHRQARLLGRPGDLLAAAEVATVAPDAALLGDRPGRAAVLEFARHYLPAFPALRRMRSSTYFTPLPL
jgi:pyridoxamine 5'-phosphate oxidase family protein